MIPTGNTRMDAEKAFDQARNASRRHALITRLRRGCLECSRLSIHDATHRRANITDSVREIPLDEITATVEPSRAAQFDAWFRPAAKRTRGRWERLWIAEQRGETLPPIDVVADRLRLRRDRRPPPRLGRPRARGDHDRRGRDSFLRASSKANAPLSPTVGG